MPKNRVHIPKIKLSPEEEKIRKIQEFFSFAIREPLAAAGGAHDIPREIVKWCKDSIINRLDIKNDEALVAEANGMDEYTASMIWIQIFSDKNADLNLWRNLVGDYDSLFIHATDHGKFLEFFPDFPPRVATYLNIAACLRIFRARLSFGIVTKDCLKCLHDCSATLFRLARESRNAN